MGNGREQERGITVRRGRRGPLAWPEEVDRFFDRAMRDFIPWRGFGHHLRPFWGEGWSPSIDVFEREGKLVIRADLPGMKREDIDVVVEGDVLVVRGRRHEEKEVKEENYYCSERAAGEFSRSISLPEGVNTDAIEATYKEGVLEITVPSPATPEPTKVKVQVK